MYYIGIVPGEETGIAVWDTRKRKIDFAELVEFWQCITKLKKFTDAHENIKVIIKTVQNKRNTGNKIDSKKIMQDARIQTASKRDFIHYINYFADMNIEYEAVELSEASWKGEELKSFTGINEQMRKQVKEAVQLVWGK